MKNILKLILATVLTLVICEVSLRLVDHYARKSAPGNEKGEGIQSQAMKSFLQDKINRLWVRGRDARHHFFEPPFDVFVNKDFHNQSRLDFIHNYVSLPKNINTTVENFLRLNDQKQNETFTVTSNDLGFRGSRNIPIEKKADTFRIVLLGSYPAFGHAVNDDETYASILENSLNQHFKGKKNIEIWNGGKQGATSIMGYSRLKKDALSLSPDLIIWDFGWIELYLGRDMVKQDGKRVELKNLNWFERQVIRKCVNTILEPLALCKFSLNKMTKVSYSDAIDGWKESMTLLREWAKENKIPVVFLRHRGVTIPNQEYTAFDAPKERMYFVDTSASLDPAPTTEEKNLFWGKVNWLSELHHTREEVEKSDEKLIFLGDAIQYNKLGYKRIGLYLADWFIKKDLQF